MFKYVDYSCAISENGVVVNSEKPGSLIRPGCITELFPVYVDACRAAIRGEALRFTLHPAGVPPQPRPRDPANLRALKFDPVYLVEDWPGWPADVVRGYFPDGGKA
jgi:hypothetical protein